MRIKHHHTDETMPDTEGASTTIEEISERIKALYDAGSIHEAEVLCGEAFELAQSLDDKDVYDLGLDLNQLASVYKDEGKFTGPILT